LPNRTEFIVTAFRPACLAALFLLPLPIQAETVVAVAANVRGAMERIVDAYQAQGGGDVTVSFGATGNFVRQIREGAPFELLLAADEASVKLLAASGLAPDQGIVYAVGQLAVVAPKGTAMVVDANLAGLRAALAAGTITRFAIANPDHAPYGARAVEALTRVGLWDAVKPHVVMGENVAQAAQFATSGNAQGGIVALSLVLIPALADKTDHAIIPSDWHQPLTQRMVLLPGAGQEATALYAYIQTPAARAILAASGYAMPAE
jgi:molybdate transport system substrate-binding protein